MEIWEERYTDEQFGKETNASFTYFQKYLSLSPPRSIKELHKEILAEKSAIKSARVVTLKTLYTYSRKWKWKLRERAFIEHLAQSTSETLKEKLLEFQLKEIDYAITHVKIHNDSIMKLHKDESIPIDKKIYAENKAEASHDIAMDKVFKISNGGSIPQKQEVKADVNSKIKKEDIKIEDSVIGELLDVLEEDSTTVQ